MYLSFSILFCSPRPINVGLVMVVFTFFGALMFAFTEFMEDRLFGKNRTIFIWTLLAYSVYRGFRLYQTYKKSRNEDQPY